MFYYQATLPFPPPVCTGSMMLVLVVLAFWFCSLAFSLWVVYWQVHVEAQGEQHGFFSHSLLHLIFLTQGISLEAEV